jgi:hypothetical protein
MAPKEPGIPMVRAMALIFADLVATIPRLAVHHHCYLWYDHNGQTGPAEKPEDRLLDLYLGGNFYVCSGSHPCARLRNHTQATSCASAPH